MKIFNARNPLLPALLLLAIVIVLLAAAARMVTALPAPTPLPTLKPPTQTRPPSPTVTLTITLTPTPSPRPTWTLRPSSTVSLTPTPTPTATGTPRPSLTPAKPFTNNYRYLLHPWSPAEATRLIEQLMAYPESLVGKDGSRLTPEVDSAFYYAAVAQREALLRFPDDPSAIRWGWDLAYALARSRGDQAGGQYAGLITGALNARQVIVSDLPGWFSQQDPRMALTVFSLPVAPGFLSSQLVEVTPSGYEPGSAAPGGAAYLWLLETPNGFQAHVLGSQFSFARQIRSGFSLGDLTGDGIPEAVIFYSPEPDGYPIQPPRAWSLSQVPPVELPFEAALPFEVGLDYTNDWKAISNGSPLLRFTATLFPSCPVQIRRDYHWTGEVFTFSETQFDIQPQASLLAFCQFNLDHAALFFGPEVTAQFMEKLLPSWSPEQDTQGKPYPLDAPDELRFRLGVNQALAGQRDDALRTLEEVAGKPTTPASRWIEPAKAFLAAYQAPEDLYRACVSVEACDPRPALQRLAGTIPLSDYANAAEHLKRFGVTLRTSSVFDFDGDGQEERWFLVRHREVGKLEFWILARAPQAVRALFVETTDSDDPRPHYHNPAERPPIVQLRLHEGFILDHVPELLEPYITHVDVEFVPTTFTLDALNEAEKALFERGDPAQVADGLASLAEDSSRFNCKNYRICDRYYYTLGLAYELSGKDRDAIDWYVKLWWEYSQSPYTIMARLKLLPIPTRTPTATVTRTVTPTRNPLITLTVTPTPNPFATITRTPTPTNTGEPYPFQSETPTKTEPYP